jgi:hypothetical protein
LPAKSSVSVDDTAAAAGRTRLLLLIDTTWSVGVW